MNDELPKPCRKVLKSAETYGLNIDIKTMKTSTRTAEEAAEAIGCGVSQIVKSLVFRGKNSGEAILILVAGDNRVKERLVARTIGEPITRPDANFVREVTGFAIGGIPPFGHKKSLKTMIDQDLLKHSIVYGAGGTPNTIFGVDPNWLVEILKADVTVVTPESDD